MIRVVLRPFWVNSNYENLIFIAFKLTRFECMVNLRFLSYSVLLKYWVEIMSEFNIISFCDRNLLFVILKTSLKWSSLWRDYIVFSRVLPNKINTQISLRYINILQFYNFNSFFLNVPCNVMFVILKCEFYELFAVFRLLHYFK